MSDSPVRTCPSCKKRRVERLISTGGGLVFKGPGFYATDYRKDPPAKKTGLEDKAKSGKSASKSGGEGSGTGGKGSGSSPDGGDAS